MQKTKRSMFTPNMNDMSGTKKLQPMKPRMARSEDDMAKVRRPKKMTNGQARAKMAGMKQALYNKK